MTHGLRDALALVLLVEVLLNLVVVVDIHLALNPLLLGLRHILRAVIGILGHNLVVLDRLIILYLILVVTLLIHGPTLLFVHN